VVNYIDVKLFGKCNRAQVKAATLRNKEKLSHLSLEWSSKINEEPVPDSHKKVLDALEPHDGLEMLRILATKAPVYQPG
jgi:hypothetical protein